MPAAIAKIRPRTAARDATLSIPRSETLRCARAGRDPRGGKPGVDRILTAIEDAIICVAILGALAIGVAQVVLRYAFNFGFVWTEEIFVTLTVLGALVGGSRAVANGVHVRIFVVTDAIGPAARRLAYIVALAATTAYSGLVAYAGFLFVEFLHSVGDVSVNTGLGSWIVFSIVPFTMILFVLRYLQQIPGTLAGREAPGHDHVE